MAIFGSVFVRHCDCEWGARIYLYVYLNNISLTKNSYFINSFKSLFETSLCIKCSSGCWVYNLNKRDRITIFIKICQRHQVYVQSVPPWSPSTYPCPNTQNFSAFYGVGGGRGVHVWDRMYTRGGFMSMYGKTNTVL